MKTKYYFWRIKILVHTSSIWILLNRTTNRWVVMWCFLMERKLKFCFGSQEVPYTITNKFLKLGEKIGVPVSHLSLSNFLVSFFLYWLCVLYIDWTVSYSIYYWYCHPCLSSFYNFSQRSEIGKLFEFEIADCLILCKLGVKQIFMRACLRWN